MRARTGTGGIANIVPLLTHGAAEAEGSDVDANWILGINTAGNVIAADFEGIDDPAPTPTGQNAPVSGTTAITDNVWHHAAATFNGTTFAVYLDGNLEASITPGFHPRSDSAQPVALGAMLKKADGLPTAGRFQGVLDEARVWNVARTELQIQGSMNQELTSGSGPRRTLGHGRRLRDDCRRQHRHGSERHHHRHRLFVGRPGRQRGAGGGG